MCGVFGYIASTKANGPDTKTLRTIAAYNEDRRGGHAWGVAWVDHAGKLKMFKQAGKVDGPLLAAIAEDARLLVGHLRWTTQGSEKSNINNHPHPCDGGWLVHNGVLPDYWDIKETFSVPPASDCDSEMLAIAFAEAPGASNAAKADWMLRTCQPSRPSPLVVLALWHDRLLAVRQGNPLTIYTGGDDGTYLSSLPVPGLIDAGKPASIKDETVTEWKMSAGRVKRSRGTLEHRPVQVMTPAPSKFDWWGR